MKNFLNITGAITYVLVYLGIEILYKHDVNFFKKFLVISFLIVFSFIMYLLTKKKPKSFSPKCRCGIAIVLWIITFGKILFDAPIQLLYFADIVIAILMYVMVEEEYTKSQNQKQFGDKTD